MRRQYYYDGWAKFVYPVLFWLTTVSLYLACLHFQVGNIVFAGSAAVSALALKFAVGSVGEWVGVLVSRGVSNGRHVYYAGSYRQTRVIRASDGEDIFLAIIWFGASFLLFWSLGGGR